MKVVKVYGSLRRWLGGRCRFEFHADTPAQALKALCVNFPGLERWLIEQEGQGVGFRVSIGRERVTRENLESLGMPWSEREVFTITPVIAGAGRGTGQILAGIGLIALSFAFPGAGVFGAGMGIFGPLSAGTISTLTTVGSAISIMGAGLILKGVAQIISPTPELGFNTGKESARLESFSFSGIVNTSKQGLPIAIAYGRPFAGSAVISSGLDTDQLV